MIADVKMGERCQKKDLSTRMHRPVRITSPGVWRQYIDEHNFCFRRSGNWNDFHRSDSGPPGQARREARHPGHVNAPHRSTPSPLAMSGRGKEKKPLSVKHANLAKKKIKSAAVRMGMGVFVRGCCRPA